MIQRVLNIILLIVFVWVISPIKSADDISMFFNNDLIEQSSDMNSDASDEDSLEKKIESKFLFGKYSCYIMSPSTLTNFISNKEDLAFVHLEIQTPPPDRIS